jgi:hypothetical protein
VLTEGSYILFVEEYDGIARSDVGQVSFSVVDCTVDADDLLTGFLLEDIGTAWLYVPFAETYASTPVVLATPQTQRNGDNYPIPRIRSVTTA